MTSRSNDLAVSRSAGVVTVVMNWSGQRGVLGPELAVELSGVLLEVAADSAARAVVLSGVDDLFAAGRDDLPEIELLVDVITRHPVPVIAAVQRACIGAGLALALACPRRYVAHDAILCPTPGASDRGAARQLLFEEVGPEVGRRLLSSGVIDPASLAEWGVDVRVVPAGDVLALAQEDAYAVSARPVIALSRPLPRRRRSTRTMWAAPDARTVGEAAR
ncbi:hypothetical protein ASE01_01010 [Nocardioides sp. Root190]|uniref:enoyl-CoA hydratase/isomerase family protein n=1 Tax=Nocardioides sp. Root190 TaxID=1736488 RepID=UPI0006FEACF8|nr:enoyl-CoA hydratase/isomerase family protein [Nocardioides sp. Root190]KRB80114.1 hypothetical protein ASE01_01010 [Nocardioides sp. Root190]